MKTLAKPAALNAAQLRKWLMPRPASSHKGANGHLLICAGSRGMSGAALLSALGALRVGAGLVTVATLESLCPVIASFLPEVLTLALPETPEGALSERAADALLHYSETHRLAAAAIGPGLTTQPGAAAVVHRLLKTWKLPIVLDADGLNNSHPAELRHSGPRVLTPHPGEMARLLGIGIAAVEKDRVAIARQTGLGLGVVCLLKGHRTVISDGHTTRINPTGNAAMATGGMGDVLTGVIGGLLAQGLALFEAACTGAYLHGLAADIARVTDRGLLAREVADAVPRALRRIHGPV